VGRELSSRKKPREIEFYPVVKDYTRLAEGWPPEASAGAAPRDSGVAGARRIEDDREVPEPEAVLDAPELGADSSPAESVKTERGAGFAHGFFSTMPSTCELTRRIAESIGRHHPPKERPDTPESHQADCQELGDVTPHWKQGLAAAQCEDVEQRGREREAHEHAELVHEEHEVDRRHVHAAVARPPRLQNPAKEPGRATRPPASLSPPAAAARPRSSRAWPSTLSTGSPGPRGHRQIV
jgi:hypothetical protein